MEPQPAIKFADAQNVPRVVLPVIRWQGRSIYLKQLQKSCSHQSRPWMSAIGGKADMTFWTCAAHKPMSADPSAPLRPMSAMPIRGTRSVQSCFFLADLRDAFFMLAFSVARFLEATFFATFFFVRVPGFFAPIAAATLPQTAPGAAVAEAAAVAAAAAAAWASSPARVLVPSAALLPAATTVSCALVLMLLRVIFHSPAERTTQKHSTRDNQCLEEVRVCAGFNCPPSKADIGQHIASLRSP